MNNKKSAVIFGAGPAGLTAGYELIKKGYQVTILEKDPQYVGGISRTVRYKDYRFDIGGHRFFSKNQDVVKWWYAIMGEDFLLRPRISRWYYRKKFFNYPINIFEIIYKFGLLFAIKISSSLLIRKIFPIKPEANLDIWFRNNFGDFLAKPFFIDYNNKLWGIPCEKLSTDFAKQRIKGVSIKNALSESIKRVIGIKGRVKSFIQEFNYPKYGPGELWERVSKYIVENGGQVLMGCEVKSISVLNNRVEKITVKEGKKEREIFGDLFLSTLPYKELALMIEPRLNAKAINAASGLKFRDFITVALVINRPFITKDTWVYTHDEGSRSIRFQNFRNWSPYMIPNDEVSVVGLEYTCTFKDEFWNLTNEELKNQGKNDFLKMGFASENEIIDAEVVKMRNVYPVYEIGYDEKVKIIRKELDNYSNLYAFGRGGIHRYNNSDHSMMTAFLTIKNIIAGNKIFDVFKVNADAEYHEEGYIGN